MTWIGRMGPSLSQSFRPASTRFKPSYRDRAPWPAPRRGPTRRQWRRVSALSGLMRSGGGGLGRNGAAHDMLDVAAANADVFQLPVGELRQFAHGLAITAPSGELLRDRLEGGHFYSFSSR